MAKKIPKNLETNNNTEVYANKKIVMIGVRSSEGIAAYYSVKHFFLNLLPDQRRPRLPAISAGGTDSPRPGFILLHNTSYSLRYTVYNIAFSEAWSRVQASPPAQSDVFPCRPACLLLLCYLLSSGVDVPWLPSAVSQVQVQIPVSPKAGFRRRPKFFSPEPASRCHQSAVRIPVSPPAS